MAYNTPYYNLRLLYHNVLIHTRFNFNKSLGNKAVDKHNSLGKGTNIYFACGFSLSSDFPTLSMQELLAKADEPMYEDKQRWYDKHTQDFL